MGLSPNKVKCFFWEKPGIIYISYLQKRRTIHGEYIINLLDPFNNDLKKNNTVFGQKESAFPTGQCKGADVTDRYDKI